jgi:hemerythrin
MKNETTCATFLKQLQTDHKHFDLQVLQVRTAFQKALEQPLAGPERRHVVESLQMLRDQLRKHFAQEENEGCLWEAASYNAALCNDVKKVLGEHPAMLSRIDEIISAASKNESRAEWAAEALREFDKLARVLAEHESRETNILEKSLPDA